VTVTSPKGFAAAGLACGIKPSGNPDLALVATADGKPVTAAAVFTSNLAPAAPVQVSRSHLSTSGNQAAAVILNSGNANAATGKVGVENAETMAALVAAEIGCDPAHVLVCSTGLIGIPLPMSPVESGIKPLCAALTADGGESAAEAIMTTDTKRKQALFEGDGWTVGGMAKGAAMLAPNMATMLAVVTTDAAVDAPTLQRLLQSAVDKSFNALSVDGCTSTNDTVIVLASGAAGKAPESDLADGLADVCASLARQMAADAEGATKVVTVKVEGAADDDQASRAARKVAESQLVKCSWYGEDPYWGRVVSELATADVAFDPDVVSIAYGETVVCENGIAIDHDADEVRAHMALREITVTCNLNVGDGKGVILTNDLTHGYIDENRTTS
jgi:glutamate N-acetyltransferase / amino-acid N-acetyltransferase